MDDRISGIGILIKKQDEVIKLLDSMNKLIDKNNMKLSFIEKRLEEIRDKG